MYRRRGAICSLVGQVIFSPRETIILLDEERCTRWDVTILLSEVFTLTMTLLISMFVASTKT